MSSPGEIKKEIAEGFEIFAIRKTLRSLWSFIIKPRQVVESLYQGKDEYVKPVRFIFYIAAPALLVLNLFDLDVRGAVSENFMEGVSLDNPDPLVRYAKREFVALFTTFTAKIVGEYNPLMYFSAAPIMALIIRKIHPDKSLSFYFFLAMSWYMMGVDCLYELTHTIVVASTGWQMSEVVSDWVMWLSYLFPIYVVVSIMPGEMVSRILRAILAVGLSWISIFSTLLVIILTLVVLWVINIDWVPTKTTGYTVKKISNSLRETHGIEIKKGVCVTGVEPDSPADRAGLREGDVLVIVENDSITSTSSERVALDRVAVGDSVSLVVNRKGVVAQMRMRVLPRDSVFRKGKAGAED